MKSRRRQVWARPLRHWSHVATGKGRIDGHTVARLQPLHGRTGFQHRSRTLVPKCCRILKDLVADASVEIVMDVGAANADTVDLQEHVVGPLERGSGTSTNSTWRRAVKQATFMALLQGTFESAPQEHGPKAG